MDPQHCSPPPGRERVPSVLILALPVNKPPAPAASVNRSTTRSLQGIRPGPSPLPRWGVGRTWPLVPCRPGGPGTGGHHHTLLRVLSHGVLHPASHACRLEEESAKQHQSSIGPPSIQEPPLEGNVIIKTPRPFQQEQIHSFFSIQFSCMTFLGHSLPSVLWCSTKAVRGEWFEIWLLTSKFWPVQVHFLCVTDLVHA